MNNPRLGTDTKGQSLLQLLAKMMQADLFSGES
jgi:hypothetical protein